LIGRTRHDAKYLGVSYGVMEKKVKKWKY